MNDQAEFWKQEEGPWRPVAAAVVFTRGSSGEVIAAGIAVEGDGRLKENKASMRKRKTAIFLLSNKKVGRTALKENMCG